MLLIPQKTLCLAKLIIKITQACVIMLDLYTQIEYYIKFYGMKIS